MTDPEVPPPPPEKTAVQQAVPQSEATHAPVSSSKTWLPIVVAVAVLVVVVVALGGFLLGRSGGSDSEVIASGDSKVTTTDKSVDERSSDDDPDKPDGSVAGSTTGSTTSSSTTVGAREGGILDAAGGVVPSGGQAPPSTTAIPANRDPNLLPAGLYCRDLRAQGYSYAAAVEYWRREGMTERMDADRNGIPCETVYPRSDVVAYWPEETYDDYGYYTLPSGLLCADLADMGIGVYEALVYYIWEGYPSRMDADADGVPCETVYPDAEWIWLTEF